MVVPDNRDSDKQVEQAYAQSAAPSSTNAVIEGMVVFLGRKHQVCHSILMVLAGRLASVEQQ